MDVTVIKTWWLASWEVKITMAMIAFTVLDPVTWIATNPDYMAMIPFGLAAAVAFIVKWLYMGGMLWLRFFKTDSKVVFNKSEATPQVDKDKARAIATVKTSPTAADLVAATETIKRASEVADTPVPKV